jgi:hypothetical protein
VEFHLPSLGRGESGDSDVKFKVPGFEVGGGQV